MGPGFEPLRVYNVTAEAVQVCIIFWFKIDALLAQLVEQLTLNQWVQGSSPWECTKSAALSQGKAADFFVSGLSHSPFSIRIFLPRKTRQPSTILAILLNIKRIKVTSWKHKPVTTLHLCWVGGRDTSLKIFSSREKVFTFCLIFFTICAEKVCYKVCNACYKVSNTCYKVCNTCYKLCNKNFLIGWWKTSRGR